MTVAVDVFVPALESVDLDCAGLPPMRVHQRVRATCGCAVYLGYRTDRTPEEIATIATPCAPAHRPCMVRFNDLMVWSLQHGGTDRPLVDVVGELLDEAFTETAR